MRKWDRNGKCIAQFRPKNMSTEKTKMPATIYNVMDGVNYD